jgi:hypothetical protein
MEHLGRRIAGPHDRPQNVVVVVLSDADKRDGNAARKTDSVFDVQHRLASRVSAADMSARVSQPRITNSRQSLVICPAINCFETEGGVHKIGTESSEELLIQPSVAEYQAKLTLGAPADLLGSRTSVAGTVSEYRGMEKVKLRRSILQLQGRCWQSLWPWQWGCRRRLVDMPSVSDELHSFDPSARI